MSEPEPTPGPAPSLAWRAVRWLLLVAGSYALVVGFHHTAWYQGRLYRELTTGPAADCESHARALAAVGGERLLINAMGSPRREVRDAAQQALDAHWFAAEGLTAARELLTAETAMTEGRDEEALYRLGQLIILHPTYAEAINRRASLLWRMGRVHAAIQDCERVLRLNPFHYGAWQGLGVCHLQSGNETQARKCLEIYQRLRPFDEEAERWLKRCDKLKKEERRSKPRPPAEPVV
jgi:tetratricopeptide (TPR) repeat protein